MNANMKLFAFAIILMVVVTNNFSLICADSVSSSTLLVKNHCKDGFDKEVVSGFSDVNRVNFGEIIKTKMLWDFFIFLSDIFVVDKQVNISKWNPSVNNWLIELSAEPFHFGRLDYVLYEVRIEIEDQMISKKDIIVGSDGGTLSFPVELNDVNPGEIKDITVRVSGGVVSPLFNIPLSIDLKPENNIGLCTFTLL